MTIRYSPVVNVSLYSAFTLNFNYILEKERKNSNTKLCLHAHPLLNSQYLLVTTTPNIPYTTTVGFTFLQF